MVRRTIEGTWLRLKEAPYLWYEEPAPDEIPRIRSEVREPKHSDESVAPSLSDLVEIA